VTNADILESLALVGDAPAGLRAIGGDVERALEDVNVPAYVIDSTGVIRWLNEAGLRMVGDVRGLQFTSVVAPEESRRSRELFARTLHRRSGVTDAELVLVDRSGERLVAELSSVPLRQGGRVIGVFGQVADIRHSETRPHPHLTKRQTEVLRLLAYGRSTRQIAEELHLARETVRNHIRAILRALGVHSRIEAVAIAHHGFLAD
jgi:PAS domain S-box-containing protein